MYLKSVSPSSLLSCQRVRTNRERVKSERQNILVRRWIFDLHSRLLKSWSIAIEGIYTVKDNEVWSYTRLLFSNIIVVSLFTWCLSIIMYYACVLNNNTNNNTLPIQKKQEQNVLASHAPTTKTNYLTHKIICFSYFHTYIYKHIGLHVHIHSHLSQSVCVIAKSMWECMWSRPVWLRVWGGVS